MKTLAEHLGVIDPRPEEKRDTRDFDNLVDVTDPKEFCRRILNTREWRQYVMNGIVLGDLPPAVMTRILDHGWGKPVEHLEIKDKTDRLENISLDTLKQRVEFLQSVIRQLEPINSSEENTVH